MKLLSKNAEERYQSAKRNRCGSAGVSPPARCCRENRGLPPCRPGQDGQVPDPEKLYGRDREIETLLDAFGRVAAGRNELMLISGSAGIGKTALVREIYKPLTEKRAYFISGKFDQYHRNIPYHGLIQAFQALVKQILSESQESLSSWRVAMLTALGPNGRVIIDVIPG